MEEIWVKNQICRPGNAMHFMLINSIANNVEVIADGQPIAVSSSIKKVKEVGYDIYEPRLYFPRKDVDFTFLRESKKTSYCPLKGEAQYFDIIIEDKVIENAAWSYVAMLTFDKRLSEIEGYVAFYKEILLTIEYPNTN